MRYTTEHGVNVSVTAEPIGRIHSIVVRKDAISPIRTLQQDQVESEEEQVHLVVKTEKQKSIQRIRVQSASKTEEQTSEEVFSDDNDKNGYDDASDKNDHEVNGYESEDEGEAVKHSSSIAFQSSRRVSNGSVEEIELDYENNDDEKKTKSSSMSFRSTRKESVEYVKEEELIKDVSEGEKLINDISEDYYVETEELIEEVIVSENFAEIEQVTPDFFTQQQEDDEREEEVEEVVEEKNEQSLSDKEEQLENNNQLSDEEEQFRSTVSSVEEDTQNDAIETAHFTSENDDFIHVEKEDLNGYASDSSSVFEESPIEIEAKPVQNDRERKSSDLFNKLKALQTANDVDEDIDNNHKPISPQPDLRPISPQPDLVKSTPEIKQAPPVVEVHDVPPPSIKVEEYIPPTTVSPSKPKVAPPVKSKPAAPPVKKPSRSKSVKSPRELEEEKEGSTDFMAIMQRRKKYVDTMDDAGRLLGQIAHRDEKIHGNKVVLSRNWSLIKEAVRRKQYLSFKDKVMKAPEVVPKISPSEPKKLSYLRKYKV